MSNAARHHPPKPFLRMLPKPAVLIRYPRGNSAFYSDIHDGLFTVGVKIGGARAVAWPEHEVVALVAARVAGKSNTEIRALVQQLHEMRAKAFEEATGEIAVDGK